MKMRFLAIATVWSFLSCVAPNAAQAGEPLCRPGAIPVGSSVNGLPDSKYAVTKANLVGAMSPEGTFWPIGSEYETQGAGPYFGFRLSGPGETTVRIESESPTAIRSGYQDMLSRMDSMHPGMNATTALPASAIVGGKWPLQVAPCKWQRWNSPL